LHDFDADGTSVKHSGKERLNEAANYIDLTTIKIRKSKIPAVPK
jgi:hypothetical protein